jgi:hypothetical protein
VKVGAYLVADREQISLDCTAMLSWTVHEPLGIFEEALVVGVGRRSGGDECGCAR